MRKGRNGLTSWAVLVQALLAREFSRDIELRDRILAYLYSSFKERVQRRRETALVEDFRKGAQLLPNDLALAISLTSPPTRHANHPKPDTAKNDEFDPIIATQRPQSSPPVSTASFGADRDSEVIQVAERIEFWLRNRYWK